MGVQSCGKGVTGMAWVGVEFSGPSRTGETHADCISESHWRQSSGLRHLPFFSSHLPTRFAALEGCNFQSQESVIPHSCTPEHIIVCLQWLGCLFVVSPFFSLHQLEFTSAHKRSASIVLLPGAHTVLTVTVCLAAVEIPKARRLALCVLSRIKVILYCPWVPASWAVPWPWICPIPTLFRYLLLVEHSLSWSHLSFSLLEIIFPSLEPHAAPSGNI